MSFGVSDQSESQSQPGVDQNERLRLAIFDPNRPLDANSALRHGALLNGVPGQMPPLHLTAQAPNFRITRLLLDKQADPFVLDPDGRLAITVAIDNEHWGVAELLLNAAQQQLELGAVQDALMLLWKEPRILTLGPSSVNDFAQVLSKKLMTRRTAPLAALVRECGLGVSAPLGSQRQILCRLIAQAAVKREPNLLEHLLDEPQSIDVLELWLRMGVQPAPPQTWPDLVFKAWDDRQTHAAKLLTDAWAATGAKAYDQVFARWDPCFTTVNTVRWLLERGAKPRLGQALETAIEHRLFETAKLFIDFGAELNVRHLELAQQAGHPGLLALLKANGLQEGRPNLKRTRSMSQQATQVERTYSFVDGTQRLSQAQTSTLSLGSP